MEEVLEATYWNNTMREWLIAAVIAVATLAVLWGIEWILKKRFAAFAKRTRFDFDDIVLAAIEATRFWFLLLVAIWAGTLALEFEPATYDKFGIAVTLGLLLQGGFWATAAIRAWVRTYSARHQESDPAAVTTVRAGGVVARMAVWAFFILAALQTFGIDVTALIAGLGIGGIAVALAAQNILGDLFASLSIVLDKPFVIGDFIIVGDMMGTVEQVGLKTTRVRSLSGEQLVFGNSDLLASRIRNFKRMQERRIQFTVGVTYQTPREKLEAIPVKIREIVEAHEGTRIDRSHLKQFGAFSIDFETVYYVAVPDYNVYMDRQQAINLAIHEYFESAGIEFAYPTQTLFLERGETMQSIGTDRQPGTPGPSLA